MISYKGLKVLLAQKEMSKTDLRELIGFSTATLAKFEKGEPVSLNVLEKICLELNCEIQDIVKILPDKAGML